MQSLAACVRRKDVRATRCTPPSQKGGDDGVLARWWLAGWLAGSRGQPPTPSKDGGSKKAAAAVHSLEHSCTSYSVLVIHWRHFDLIVGTAAVCKHTDPL